MSLLGTLRAGCQCSFGHRGNLSSSISREAVKMTRAAGVDERLLAAPLAQMRGNPGRVLAAPVGVTEHGARTVCWDILVCLRVAHPVRGPVVAGVIVPVDECSAIEVRTGQDVVLIARNRLALDIEDGLAIDVDGRIRSPRVIDVLSRLVSERGAPAFLRSDNGPEFVSKALLSWVVAQGMTTALIEPGKPWQNGVTESFNGKFRDECLSLEWFRSRAEAKVIIETWRRHYNEVRPHSSLGYLTPNEFVARQANAASRQATGQGAAVCGPPRPGPLLNPLRKGHVQQARDAVSS